MIAGIRLSRDVKWNNELSICWSGKLSDQVADNVADYYSLANMPFGDYSNLFLMYHLGFSLGVSKNVSISPSMAFPLFNITGYYLRKQEGNYTGGWPPPYSSLKAYYSWRAGVAISFTLNKK